MRPGSNLVAVADPWNSGPIAALGQPGGAVTLVEGSTFCISDTAGDVHPGTPHGLFFLDTRFLSEYALRINGHHPEALAASPENPFAAGFVARVLPRPGLADSPLMVFRRRYIGFGMREDLSVRNFGEEASYCRIELQIDADFGDLFDV